ncbi:MAG TPA: carboxymuconolactone decarboxylase family protein [Jatrophihabitantaceae bacterium]|nr:carboxymuconolactone decarboxylase family protein [Jatrophihabitantaceae bacterium]
MLERPRRRRARMFLRAATLSSRSPADPVIVMLLHRPELFGTWFELLPATMRGPSYWTPEERELIAVATSTWNDCPFCVSAHTEVAALERRSAEPRPELKVMLEFLENVTRCPVTLTPEDAAPVRAAGIPDDAIEDALYVNFVFNMVNRLVHAFGFQWESDRHLHGAAHGLHRYGYRIPPYLTR